MAEAGTVRLELLSEIVTEAPPAGAAPLNVIVQVELPGVLTVVGVHAKEVMVGGAAGAASVKLADFEAPP